MYKTCFDVFHDDIVSRMKDIPNSRDDNLVAISNIMGKIRVRLEYIEKYADMRYHSAIQELHLAITTREFYDTVWNNEANDWAIVLKTQNKDRYKQYMECYGGERMSECYQFKWYIPAYNQYNAKYFIPEIISTLNCVEMLCQDNITDIMEFVGIGSMDKRECLRLIYQ